MSWWTSFLKILEEILSPKTFDNPSEPATIIPVESVPMPSWTPQPVSQETPSLLTMFCQEIQSMEGWSAGSCSFTHNNPGNLRCPVGQFSSWNILANGTEGGFCTFKNEPMGFQALVNVTESCAKGESPTYNTAAKHFGLANSGELNLYQYFLIRDPADDGNDPDALAVRFGKKLGVDPSTFQMKGLL